MVQNVWEEIIENLNFVENSNLMRGSTEEALLGCSEFKGKYPIIVKLQAYNFTTTGFYHKCFLMKQHFYSFKYKVAGVVNIKYFFYGLILL